MALVLRNVKGSRLTFTELDGNFTYLQGLDLSGVTFNSGSGLLTLTRNNGGTLSTTISGLTSTDQFVSGGTFNTGTDNIDFVGNSTDTTFSVDLSSLISTVSGDTYVISGNADAGNQTLTFTNNSGGTFNVTNAAALFSDNDINVTGGTYNPTSGCVTFSTNSGSTFNICGFLTGMTDTYVTGGTLNISNELILDLSNGSSASAIDLSALVTDELNELIDANTNSNSVVLANQGAGVAATAGTGDGNFVALNGALSGSTGNDNIVIGRNAAKNKIGAAHNIVMGLNALGSVSTSSPTKNIMIGYRTGFNLYSNTENIMIGYQAGDTTTSNDYSTIIGSYAGLYQYGDYQTIIGYRAGQDDTGYGGTTGYPTLLGAYAGYNVVGIGNIAIGYEAGYNKSAVTQYSGTNNIILGNGVLLNASGTTRQFVVGGLDRYLLSGDYNTTDRTKLGVNISNNIPTANLQVKGHASDPTTLLVQDGSNNSLLLLDNVGNLHVTGRTTTENFTMLSGATADYVLTSDASGNARWAASSGGGTMSFTVEGDNGTPFLITSGDTLEFVGLTGIDIGVSDPEVRVAIDYNGADSFIMAATNGTGITVDGANDKLVLYDDDAAEVKYINVDQISGGGGCTDLDCLTDCVTNATSMWLGSTSGSGNYNTALGIQALDAVAIATGYNTAVGYKAASAVNVAYGMNVAMGYEAMGNANADSQYNTCVGTQAGQDMDSGNEYNSFFGYQTGKGSGTSSGSRNAGVGATTLTAFSTGGYNSGIGYGALAAVTTGNGNTGLGYLCGNGITEGDYNIVMGYDSDVVADADYQMAIGFQVATTQASSLFLGRSGIGLLHGDFATAAQTKLGINLGNTFSAPTATLHVKGQSNTDSTVNFLIQNGDGDQIMRLADSGENILIGYAAGDSITPTSGLNNICIGYNAGTAITTADNNVIIGAYAGSDASYNVSGSILIGYGAGQNLQFAGATANVYIGYQAGNQNDDWQYGTYMGYRAGRRIEGGNNVAIGAEALEGGVDNAGAFDSTALGYQALRNVTTGDDNTAVGYQAGDSISTGANNIFIGHGADGNATADNQIGIGQGVTVAGANTIDLGNASITTANIPVAWTVTSDSRTKKDILTCDLGLDFVNALLPKKYKRLHPADYPDQIKERRYKSGGKNYDDATSQAIKDYYEPHHDENTYGYEYGLVAQDVKSLMDGNSTFNEFSGWKEEIDGTQGLQYQTFIPPIIKAIQELDDKVGSGSGSGVAKKVITDTFVGDTPKTLQHNLNDEDVIVQVWDASNELITPNAVLVQNNNEISVEVSQSGTYTVIITGGILNGVILTGTTSSGGSGGTDGFTGATKNGVSVNTDVRHNLNLIEGPNISLNVLDNQSNDSVDVTISAEADQYSATTVNSGVINWDTAVSTQFEVTLTENATLNLEGLISGQYGTMIVTQDNTGGRTLTLGTVNGGVGSHKVVNGGGGELVLTVNANAIDIISFTYNGTNLYWTVGNDYT